MLNSLYQLTQNYTYIGGKVVIAEVRTDGPGGQPIVDQWQGVPTQNKFGVLATDEVDATPSAPAEKDL